MPSLAFDLPDKFRRGHTAHLLWKSEDGKRVDAVGLKFVQDGGEADEWFNVTGNADKARRMIDEKVVPLLCEVYGLDPATGGPLGEAEEPPLAETGEE